jgi:outer membrane protein assembly factor BamB
MKKGLAIGIIFLFLFSALAPMSIGYNTLISNKNKSSELDRALSDLEFMCITPYGFNSVKYEYYKEQILKQYNTKNTNDNTQIRTKDVSNSKFDALLESLSLFYGPMNSVWSTKCHDISHTGRSTISTSDNSYTEKWRFYSSLWVREGAVFDNDGIIYFAGAYNNLDYYLFAVYPNGIEKWKFKTNGSLFSTPAIADDGTVYIGSWDARFYAINPDSTEKWRFGSGAPISSSPVIDIDGTIYFGTLGNFGVNSRFYAVNPNGTEKWHYTINDRIYSDPCIGSDGTIYFGSDDTYFYAMYSNGTLRWRYKTGDCIKAPPSVASDGTVYIGSYDGYLYAFYPSGILKWKCNIGYGTALNPSIASDGTIYVGSDRIYAIYPNGTIRWVFNMGEDRYNYASSPAISADGTIYVGTNIGDVAGGEIIAINPNGTEKWRKKIAKYWVDSSPSIGEDGTVYIGSAYNFYEGYLHAFGNIESNSPPDGINISGPTLGKVGESYWFNFVSHDPDNNPIQLFVDWGDGNSGWVDWFASDETMWAQHSWSVNGSFTIKAMVKDVMGEEGPWNMFNVTIKPKVRAIYDFNWMDLSERFTILYRLMNSLNLYF